MSKLKNHRENRRSTRLVPARLRPRMRGRVPIRRCQRQSLPHLKAWSFPAGNGRLTYMTRPPHSVAAPVVLTAGAEVGGTAVVVAGEMVVAGGEDDRDSRSYLVRWCTAVILGHFTIERDL